MSKDRDDYVRRQRELREAEKRIQAARAEFLKKKDVEAALRKFVEGEAKRKAAEDRARKDRRPKK